VRRLAAAAGLAGERIGNHSFRVTGITAFLDGGGEISRAQKMAGHASMKTTTLYDRRSKAIGSEDVELIGAAIRGGKRS
jgi:integrase